MITKPHLSRPIKGDEEDRSSIVYCCVNAGSSPVFRRHDPRHIQQPVAEVLAEDQQVEGNKQ